MPFSLRLDAETEAKALVCVAERDRLTRILTFDRDFDIYRLQRRTRFIVLPRD